MNASGKQIIITSGKWNIFGFLNVYAYRELVWMFIWRDVHVRYKQTLLGILWVLFQPLIMMVIFTIFFGMIIKVPSAGLPYAVFFLSGNIIWLLFYEGVTRSYSGILSNTAIITKVYFPRIILPVAGVIAPLVDFCIASCIMIALILVYGLPVSYTVVMIPLLVVWVMVLALGIGSFMSALNVKYRDIQYALPFMLLLWGYVSPVIYPASLIPVNYHWIYYLNPMAWIIDGMRFSLFGIPLSSESVIPALVITIVIVITGVVFFEYHERRFADYI